MRSSLRSFLYTACGVGLLALTTGCEQCEVSTGDGEETETKQGYCSVKKFTTDDRSDSAAFTSGGTVLVQSVNGRVRVERNNGSDVSATFSPFVFRAFNTEDSEIRKNFEGLRTEVNETEDGVTIRTSRASGSPTSLGAEIVVNLPSDFDGVLDIRQNNGSVDVNFAGDAAEVIIQSDNGSIEANASAPRRFVARTENGSVSAGVAVLDYVNLWTDLGDIEFSADTLAEGAGGGTIETRGLGDITLRLPSAGVYEVPATAGAGEVVDFGSPPADCMVAESAENSKRLSCGAGGPEYTVKSESGSVSVRY